MKILGAVGLALTIIVLKFLVPRIFAGIEDTILAFLDAMQRILALNHMALPAIAIPSVSEI